GHKSERNGINSIRYHNRNCAGGIPGSVNQCLSPHDDDVNMKTHEVSGKVRSPLAFPFCISILKSILNCDVLSFNVAQLAQPLPECLSAQGISGEREWRQ